MGDPSLFQKVSIEEANSEEESDFYGLALSMGSTPRAPSWVEQEDEDDLPY